ncbi:MAG: zf-HC2 domain-containing protein [Alcanivorax sp.]|jgi:anti-sigma factor RsiW|nr:zf-HC2 domain-containing protein [Alcanivorax sp.]
MLKCQHVEQRADALVDGERLPFGERLALQAHLMICRHCRRYLRQLRALVRTLRGSPDTLSDKNTEALVERILDRQSK